MLRTTYTSHFNDVFEPSLRSPPAASLIRPMSAPCPAPRSRRLPSPVPIDFVFGDMLELKFGSELQTIQFLGRVHAFKPFGSADLHLSPNTVLEYQYASSVPDSRSKIEQGFRFDDASSDPEEPGPRMSMVDFAPAVERAHHQEVSISQRIGKTNMQVAFYADSDD